MNKKRWKPPKRERWRDSAAVQDCRTFSVDKDGQEILLLMEMAPLIGPIEGDFGKLVGAFYPDRMLRTLWRAFQKRLGITELAPYPESRLSRTDRELHVKFWDLPAHHRLFEYAAMILPGHIELVLKDSLRQGFREVFARTFIELYEIAGVEVDAPRMQRVHAALARNDAIFRMRGEVGAPTKGRSSEIESSVLKAMREISNKRRRAKWRVAAIFYGEDMTAFEGSRADQKRVTTKLNCQMKTHGIDYCQLEKLDDLRRENET